MPNKAIASDVPFMVELKKELTRARARRPTTGGSMNPVRTLGPAVAAGNYRQLWIYLLAPTLGALAGAGVYTAVKLRDENGETPRTQRSFRR